MFKNQLMSLGVIDRHIVDHVAHTSTNVHLIVLDCGGGLLLTISMAQNIETIDESMVSG